MIYIHVFDTKQQAIDEYLEFVRVECCCDKRCYGDTAVIVNEDTHIFASIFEYPSFCGGRIYNIYEDSDLFRGSILNKNNKGNEVEL